MLDVPECVKHIRLTESFRQIYALVSLARTVNFFWYTLYLRCSTPNSVAQTRIGWHVTFVYCSTTLISNSVCLQWSDIIEYLLKLLIQKQIGTLSTTLWTDSNQIEIKTEYCVQEIGGDVRQSNFKMLTATTSKVALYSVGLILVQDEEVTSL